MVSDKFNICDLIKQQLKEQERSGAKRGLPGKYIATVETSTGY
ncbi:MAG: hypothetical protein PHE45_08895 [Bacteroidales bacterium]|nr:hypothetical protein [Bacteroidales bacterium]